MFKTALVLLASLSLTTTLLAEQRVVSSGEVLVNDKVLNKNGVIKVGDFIRTKKNSKVKFNIGSSAFLAKGDSRFSITKNGDKTTLNVLTGSVLAVFKHGDGEHEVKTPNMTAGIRGTGVFTEIRDDKDYFCTCYGDTEIHTHNHSIEHNSKYHKMVWAKESGDIKNAKELVGHNDNELRELEALVGRVPDFDK